MPDAYQGFKKPGFCNPLNHRSSVFLTSMLEKDVVHKLTQNMKGELMGLLDSWRGVVLDDKRHVHQGT